MYSSVEDIGGAAVTLFFFFGRGGGRGQVLKLDRRHGSGAHTQNGSLCVYGGSLL